MTTTRRSLLLSAPLVTLLPTAVRAACQDVAGSFAFRKGIEEGAAFFAAVRAGDLERARALLDARPELRDSGDEAGRSALAVALLHERRAVADLLLERGYEPDLAEAVMLSDWELAEERFRAAPALLDAYHPVGGTPLYAGARVGAGSLYLLQSWGADADGNPLGKRGVTPAHGALECAHPILARKGAVSLLSNGASVHARQRGGATLLHVAARRGDDYLVRYLIRRGAEPAARDDGGRTPLDVALEHEHAAVVKTLRGERGLVRDDMRARYAYDASGGPVVFDPLWDVPAEVQSQVTGASHNDPAAVRAALDRNPRLIFSVSTQDELAVEACAHTGNREILRMHLDLGAPQSLATSLSVGDLAGARRLLAAHPGSLHERGPHDFAPMWYPAIGGGSVEAAELLLDHGAEVDQESLGTTGLHWAVMRGHVDLVAFLLERGADPLARGYSFDAAGRTPGEEARARGRDEIVRLLADFGG